MTPKNFFYWFSGFCNAGYDKTEYFDFTQVKSESDYDTFAFYVNGFYENLQLDGLLSTADKLVIEHLKLVFNDTVRPKLDGGDVKPSPIPINNWNKPNVAPWDSNKVIC